MGSLVLLSKALLKAREGLELFPGNEVVGEKETRGSRQKQASGQRVSKVYTGDREEAKTHFIRPSSTYGQRERTGHHSRSSPLIREAVTLSRETNK